jgi:GntR family transcriptional regulator
VARGRRESPRYRQIAEYLRFRIMRGDYRPGDLLPSETELMEEHQVSRGTARQALAVLQADGLAQAAMGRGVFVREQPPARRVASDRYQREVHQIVTGRPQPQPETSFTRDQGIAWSDYRLDKDFRETGADEELAELFGVSPGEKILERHFVFYAKGEPQQMSKSCLLLRLVDGTPVADPANEPWPGGNIAQLATLHKIVSRVEESVAARMPLPEEIDTLRIPPGVPVLTITRRMLAGVARDEVVEVAKIVIPADRTILDYTVDLKIEAQ